VNLIQQYLAMDHQVTLHPVHLLEWPGRQTMRQPVSQGSTTTTAASMQVI
jgi:hypothetical protein